MSVTVNLSPWVAGIVLVLVAWFAWTVVNTKED